ncbi:MAG: insulinase family protein [Psychrobium sp.]|nr:insulinase family protein [Psychrobium sp.]
MIISSNDKKSYQHLVLDNQLEVLLICDPSTKKSSAALAVNVGHFDDPVAHEGLAHLLEHMMFMGTQRYSDANEYHEFIRQHGGSHNAWTGSEFTNFFFAIDNVFYQQSLDRFSDFFLAPLLDGQWISKEISAVDSEFQLKLKDENRRFLAVIKECINQQHPFSQFSVGNKNTLTGDDPSLETLLLDFYQQHYCASKMKLVLVSCQPLEDMAALATTYFSAIECRQLKNSYPQVPLQHQERVNISIDLVPNRDIKKLSLSFPMSLDDINYHAKPLSYIGYLIGNEGDGSLLSVLKELGLANGLSAGKGLHGYNYCEFSISVSLTDLGLLQKDKIIALIFSQISLIKQQGIDAWRYTEKHSIVKAAFDFQENSSAIELASHLVINMFHYQVQDIVYGDYALDSFEPQSIKNCLDLIAANNMRLTTVSLGQPNDKKAKWYGTPYRVRQTSDKQRQQWLVSEHQHLLSLPPANPFVVERLAYRPSQHAPSLPQLIIDEKGMRLWHLTETKFTLPKGHIYTTIDSPSIDGTVHSAALCRLYVEMLHDSLAQLTYPAEVAGMYYDIYPHQAGVTMHVSGYTPKLFLFFEMLIAKISERNFSNARFDEIKNQLGKSWRNNQQAKPINRLFKALSTTLQAAQHDYESMADALDKIDLKQLQLFISAVFSRVHLESYVQGDWEIDEVALFAQSIHRQISSVATPCDEVPRQLTLLHKQQSRHRPIGSLHDDSALIVYFQGNNTDPQTAALYSLFNQCIGPLLFSELRTKQQLGYLCGTSYMPINRYPGLILYIQSPVAAPAALLLAIEQVIRDLRQQLQEMSAEQWSHSVNGLLSQVTAPDTSQYASAQRFWLCIANKDSQFNRRDALASQIALTAKAQLIDFIDDKFLNDTVDRLILSCHGIAHNEDETLSVGIRLDDIAQFKRQHQSTSP